MFQVLAFLPSDTCNDNPLPDFDLEDEEVRLAVREAAGYFRGFQAAGKVHCSIDEARIFVEFLLKTGMISSLDELVNCAWWHNNDELDEEDCDLMVTWDDSDDIRSIQIGSDRAFPRRYRIPSAIEKFKRLELLKLDGGCESIGRALLNTSSLKKIEFRDFYLEEAFVSPPPRNRRN